jgi:hypothetical protein
MDLKKLKNEFIYLPESNARKTCSQKFSARPLGKNCL